MESSSQTQKMSSHFLKKREITDLSIFEMQFFITLLKTKSLSEAAKKHEITVSKASRLLKNLREALDDPLFIRSSPFLIPTARASEIAFLLKDVLQKIKGIESTSPFNPLELVRTFHIAAVDNALFTVMRKIIGTVAREAPHSTIEFSHIDANLFSSLERGSIDCAVYPSTIEVPPYIREMMLYPMKYAICLRQGHPLVHYWEKHHSLPLSELKKYRKIQLTNRTLDTYRTFLLDESKLIGKSIQETGVCTPYFLSIPSILNETDYTAVLPRDTAELLNSMLKEPLFLLPAEADIYKHQNDPGATKLYHTRLIWHERNDADPALQWLRGIFANEFKNSKQNL